MPSLFTAPSDPNLLRLVPLGGCGEFGMNLTAYLHKGRLFVVDCGVRFPEPAKLGTDAVIPNVDPHFAAAGGVTAYFMTHGHEDHIGALPHVIQKWPAPIYATPWTAGLLRNKFQKYGIPADKHPITIVEAGDTVRAPDFDVEWVHVNHSIPQSCALVIRTPGISIFHTGDFKYEQHPLVEPPMNFDYLSKLGAQGIDLLLADSTNAEKPGLGPGESAVLQPLVEQFRAASGAVLVTTFSSNLWRLVSVAKACQQAGRKLYLAGNGLETTLTLAKETGLYYLPESLQVTEDRVSSIPRKDLCVLATGCQGEGRSAMARIARHEHKHFALAPGDTVIFSSRIIPGNEKSVIYLTESYKRQGAIVVTAREAPGIHVSGHAYGGEIRLLHQALRPTYFLPVHGNYSQLAANLDQAGKAGHPEERRRIIETGDVLDVSRANGVVHKGTVEVELAYVDSDSSAVIPYATLRERLKIGELGCAIMTGTFAKATGAWVAPPELDLIGLGIPTGNDRASVAAEARRIVEREMPRLAASGSKLSDPGVCEEIRIILRRQLLAMLKKKPIVVVKIQLV